MGEIIYIYLYIIYQILSMTLRRIDIKHRVTMVAFSFRVTFTNNDIYLIKLLYSFFFID